jgi:hypothetical protein
MNNYFTTTPNIMVIDEFASFTKTVHMDFALPEEMINEELENYFPTKYTFHSFDVDKMYNIKVAYDRKVSDVFTLSGTMGEVFARTFEYTSGGVKGTCSKLTDVPVGATLHGYTDSGLSEKLITCVVKLRKTSPPYAFDSYPFYIIVKSNYAYMNALFLETVQKGAV